MLRDAHPAIANGEEREDDQRQRSSSRASPGRVRLPCARFAEEGQCDLAHGVEGGQEGRDRQGDKNPPMTMSKCICKDLILRPEASRNKRETGESKTTDQKCPECDRHLFAQAAHVEHILRIDMVIACVQNTMLHAMNDRARAEEEQRFEEGVCDEMEDSRHICTNSQRRDHEAELRDGGICQHTFDIVLCDRNRRGEYRRERADECHDGHRRWVKADEREHADDRVHTRRHHRRGMDHGADGRRTFHRVWQPDMQRELCRFTNCTDEEQQADQAQRQKNQGSHSELLQACAKFLQ